MTLPSLVVVTSLDMQLVLFTSVDFSILSNTVSNPEKQCNRSNPNISLATFEPDHLAGPIEIDGIRHLMYELQYGKWSR